jgi:hypothetical protein
LVTNRAHVRDEIATTAATPRIAERGRAAVTTRRDNRGAARHPPARHDNRGAARHRPRGVWNPMRDIGG